MVYDGIYTVYSKRVYYIILCYIRSLSRSSGRYDTAVGDIWKFMLTTWGTGLKIVVSLIER